MLDALRRGAGSWLAQLLIALLVVAFAVWGVSDIFRGFRADTLASVGNTDISIGAFQRQYDLATRALSRQLGQPISDEQAQMFGIPGQILGRLVAEATLDDDAATLRLGVSSDMLAKQIAEDPNFKGPGGTFDRNTFAQVIQSQGVTEDQYVEQLRQAYVRQQVADALAGGIEVPETYLKALHEFRNEERNISYVVVTPALVGTIPEPTDAELGTYFEANKATWKAPELRAIKAMKLTAADIADPSAVTDEEAKKVYDSQLATRFTTPEKRKIDQIVFKDAADAQAASSALTAGKTFDALVAERNLKPEDVDLGLVTKNQILDPKVADAAFALAANTVSGVLDGQFGPVILRVTTIEPEKVLTFEEAKPEIAKDLATQRSVAEVSEQHNAIEDARAGGDTLEEVAKKYDLPIVTVAAVDQDGKDADGNAVADLPGGAGLLQAAFGSDVGVENDPVPIEGGGYVWYDVTGVTPPRDRTLDEVRDKVVAAWKKDQLAGKLTAKAKEIAARLGAGEDPAKVAADSSLELKTAGKLTRTTQPNGDISTAALQAAFGGPKGYAGTAAGGADESQIALVVTDVTEPAFFAEATDLVQAKQQLAGQFAGDFLQEYVGQLQASLGLSVNQTALQQIIGPPGS